VQPGVVKIYLDGTLAVTWSSLSSAFSGWMQAILDFSFGPGFPSTGASGDLSCQYFRCWALPGNAKNCVPNVVGVSQAAASTALANAGFVLAGVSTEPSNSVAAGLVSGQSPASGIVIATGASVNLIISSGPAPALPPQPQGNNPFEPPVFKDTVPKGLWSTWTGPHCTAPDSFAQSNRREKVYAVVLPDGVIVEPHTLRRS